MEDLVKVKRAGAVGVIKDIDAHELPVGVWSDAHNIRFIDGSARQFYGHIDVLGSPENTPYFLLPYKNGDEKHWLYAGEDSIYDVYVHPSNGPTHTDVSGTTYTATPNSWTGVVLGGVPILNNGTDEPLQWDTNLANNFATLSNWPSGVICQALRSYKQFLIALNVTKSGQDYPYMVKWSHPAAPGSVPASWDEIDPDYDAGEWDLAETSGKIVDGLSLGDTFLIYKEDSIHRMDYIGGINVFSFNKVYGTTGAMNRNCIVEVDRKHFVLTSSDVILHDGRRPFPVLDKKTRRYLFQQMDSSARDKAFVFHNYFFNEVYICYPEVGETACNQALVWNYVDNTTAFRSVPRIYHAQLGAVDEFLDETWDADNEPWDADLTAWNDASLVPGDSRVLMASSDPQLYMLDAKALAGASRMLNPDGTPAVNPDGSPAFDPGTAPMVSHIERQGLSLGEDRKKILVTGIRLRVDGDVGSKLKVYAGGTDTDPYGTPNYSTTEEYTIGGKLNVDLMVSKRYFAFKIENVSAFSWSLEGFDILGVEVGEW